MLTSLFKTKPKSDRRVEWKNLKTKYAKTMDIKQIEVGLGKALDEHQKQVDRLEAATVVTEQSFAPVLASAATVKKLAIALWPKVKDKDDFSKFLLALKQDSDWWVKTSKQINQGAGQLTQKEEKLLEFVGIVLKLPRPMDLLDKALKNADKKTKDYHPPEAIAEWATHSKAVRAQLAKLALLNKNASGNVKLIAALLQDMQVPVRNALAAAKGLEAAAKTKLPPVVDWQAVGASAKKSSTDLHYAHWGMGKLL